MVLVLGLLAITLAISYATLRGQGTTTQLAQNNSRALDARVAAQSGLASALRKISENSWAGVDVPISANVTNRSWYQVTFGTGDLKLSSTDSLYSEYPFRLTVDSVGYASDAQNPAVRSQHHSRCIVQLVRKKMIAEPANWTTITGNTVYQYDNNKDAYVQFPVRINGVATMMGKLASFCPEYPINTGARDQYLSDLNARRIAGLGDDRPFPSTLNIRGIATNQDATTISLLTAKLGMTLVEPLLAPGAPVAHPGAVLSYKLYPGGRSYTVPVLQTSFGNPIQNATVGADPVNNPLGIYRSSGTLSVLNNVQVTGTIIADDTSSDIQLNGTGIRLSPFNLPMLYGSSQIYQLPAVMVPARLRVNSASAAQINGAVVVWDEFELRSGATSTSFALNGNLLVQKLTLAGRSAWTLNATTWGLDQTNFTLNLLLGLLDPNRVAYFPDYQAKTRGFVVKPTLTFTPDSSGVKPHWHDWTQPLYQPDPGDPGLKWEIVRWEENL